MKILKHPLKEMYICEHAEKYGSLACTEGCRHSRFHDVMYNCKGGECTIRGFTKCVSIRVTHKGGVDTF